MEAQKPTNKKRKLIIVIIIVVIAFCLICLAITSIQNIISPKPTSTTSAPPLPTNTIAPTVPQATNTPMDPHGALQSEITKILGDGNRDVRRLTQLNFDDPENGAIFVQWAINDNLTENLIVHGSKMDATDILKAIANSGIDYTYVIMSGSFPLVDAYGNSEESNVVNLTFYKTTVDRINWENFLNDNIFKIADEVHNWSSFQDQ